MSSIFIYLKSHPCSVPIFPIWIEPIGQLYVYALERRKETKKKQKPSYSTVYSIYCCSVAANVLSVLHDSLTEWLVSMKKGANAA